MDQFAGLRSPALTPKFGSNLQNPSRKFNKSRASTLSVHVRCDIIIIMKKSKVELGVVVIGRNEGVRLVKCLAPLIARNYPLVYVDSGSIDGSVETATSMGVSTVQLDLSIPFTAARARNIGFSKLITDFPKINFVQFVDGDCTLSMNWINCAVAFLNRNVNVAAVRGKLEEMFPDHSIYNRLCQREWQTTLGVTSSFGGVVMIRVDAFQNSGGFSDFLPAGEEPELASRILECGWLIWAIDCDMALHDANIKTFGQWWRRTARGGRAFIEVALLRLDSRTRVWLFESIRAIILGGLLPMGTLIAGQFSNFALLLFLYYPIQIFRVSIKNGAGSLFSWQYAFFMTLAKFAEFQGIVSYCSKRLLRAMYLTQGCSIRSNSKH